MRAPPRSAAQDAVKREKDAIFTQIAALKTAPAGPKV